MQHPAYPLLNNYIPPKASLIDTCEVRDLADVQSWAGDFLDAIRKYLPSGALAFIMEKLPTLSMTTTFSGIDAPGSGVAVLCDTLADMVSKPVPHPPHLSATEWDKACRKELLQHPQCATPHAQRRGGILKS